MPAAHERCIHVIVEEVVHLMHQRGISWEAANEGRVRRIRGARVGVGVGSGMTVTCCTSASASAFVNSGARVMLFLGWVGGQGQG